MLILIREYICKAWFPSNVSVLATNQSGLLVQALLSIAGFQEQASKGLFLYLEECKSLRASSIK